MTSLERGLPGRQRTDDTGTLRRQRIETRRRVPAWLVRSLTEAIDDHDVLVALGALAELHAILATVERDLFEQARRNGVTWQRIARILNLGSRQEEHARAVRRGADLSTRSLHSNGRRREPELADALAVPTELFNRYRRRR